MGWTVLPAQCTWSDFLWGSGSRTKMASVFSYCAVFVVGSVSQSAVGSGSWSMMRSVWLGSGSRARLMVNRDSQLAITLTFMILNIFI